MVTQQRDYSFSLFTYSSFVFLKIEKAFLLNYSTFILAIFFWLPPFEFINCSFLL